MPATEIDTSKTWGGLPAPSDWHRVSRIYRYDPPRELCGYAWERMTGQRLMVFEDVSPKSDGKRWLHVSVSKPGLKMPTWEDLETVRKLFVGNRECYQVFPTEERYVSHHNVLHLWACLDHPDGVLPHFERMINGKLHI